jgi:hypothetical protein
MKNLCWRRINMKHGNRWMIKVLVLVLVLSIFMVGFVVPLSTTSVMAQTTTDPGLDQYGGWKGLQGHNTTGHWTVELIGDRYWFVTPENNVLWVLGDQHCTPGPVWQDCPALGYAPTALVNQAKYASTNAWADNQVKRSEDWGFNSTLIMDSGAANVPNISRFALLDVKYLALDPTASVRVDDYFVDVFNPRYAVACAKRAEVLLRPLVNDPWTIGVYLGNEQAWNGSGNNQIGLPNMFIELPPTAAGKQYWVNTFLKTRYPTVDNLNSVYGTQFHSWDDVLQCTSIPDTAEHPRIHGDKVDFSGDIAEAYYKPMVAVVRAVAPHLLILSDRMLPINIVKYLDYNERIWKVAGEYCDIFCANSYLDYVALEKTDHIISDMAKTSGKPILISEHSYIANDTSLPADDGTWGGNRVATQSDRAHAYVDYLNGLLSMKVQGPSGQSVNPFMGIVWHKWYDDPALGTGSANGDHFNFGLLDGMDEAYTPLTDVMKTANSQVYNAITHSTPITVLPAPGPLAPINDCTTGDGATFSWQPVQGVASYTLLISPEQAFPDEQTIRIDSIQGTSYTLTSPLAQGHWWWCVKANEAATGNGGYYSQASEFMIKNLAGQLDAGLSLEQLNRVSFEDTRNVGGSASSYAFLDTTVKNQGDSSVRCVFTQWAWNKTGSTTRNAASVLLDCTGGAAAPWKGLTLTVCPTNFCDSTGNLVPSSQYLRIRAWDQSGRLFLDQPLDPQGTLPTGEWSTVTVPFGVYGSQDVSAIALTLVTGQDKIACDQRLTINVDNIMPLTNQNIMILQVGKATFTMNGSSKTLDSPPVIKNGRTLVPIRAIIEALAGTVGWDRTARKATVTLGSTTIELWIGKSVATVNGVSTPIDSTDAKVVPEIINGRTMLPLRFVTENLGATVAWEQSTQTITITYTP